MNDITRSGEFSDITGWSEFNDITRSGY
jgi:hypothetical protein